LKFWRYVGARQGQDLPAARSIQRGPGAANRPQLELRQQFVPTVDAVRIVLQAEPARRQRPGVPAERLPGIASFVDWSG